MTPKLGHGHAGVRRCGCKDSRLPYQYCMLQALPFMTPGNSQGPTPERHWQHTFQLFCFLLIFLLFVSTRVEFLLNWPLFRTFNSPRWLLGGREHFVCFVLFCLFVFEWLLIVLDHYNLCNFQRLYNIKKKKKANHRITQSPFKK